VAELIGRNRGTIPEWLTKYRSGGREELVLKKVGGGRKRKIPQWAEKALFSLFSLLISILGSKFSSLSFLSIKAFQLFSIELINAR
jgi:hypothetical protein